MLLIGFVKKKKNIFILFNSFCWLACSCLFFSFLIWGLFFFLNFSSDEVVTAAQHLYEMVSFYFDDLGELLFDDILTSIYCLLVEFHYFVACFVL